jgi:predicted nucleic-acid-binding Zn-ribbon protein
MKSGICPKCEAKEVHLYTNLSAELSINVGFLSAANLNYYICTNCGYVELFVQEKSVLPKIAEKYPKVN